MIEFRGIISGIGDAKSNPPINPISPKMDASVINAIIKKPIVKLSYVDTAYDAFSVIVDERTHFVKIETGLAICYGYRCVLANPVEFNLGYSPSKVFYGLILKVDLTGETAKFSVYCTNASNVASFPTLKHDDLMERDGTFEGLLEIIEVTENGIRKLNVTDIPFFEDIENCLYVNGFRPLYNGEDEMLSFLMSAGPVPDYNIPLVRPIFDKYTHPTYDTFATAIFGNKVNTVLQNSGIEIGDINQLQLSESLNEGDIVELGINGKIFKARVENYYYQGTNHLTLKAHDVTFGGNDDTLTITNMSFAIDDPQHTILTIGPVFEWARVSFVIGLDRKYVEKEFTINIDSVRIWKYW